jgi:hypothetical protein
LAQEENAAVRVVPGHFIFVYIQSPKKNSHNFVGKRFSKSEIPTTLWENQISKAKFPHHDKNAGIARCEKMQRRWARFPAATGTLPAAKDAPDFCNAG